jgi:serine protease AprX
MSFISAEFSVNQSPFSLEPTITAQFNAEQVITRAHYAVLTSRLFAQYYQ